MPDKNNSAKYLAIIVVIFLAIIGAAVGWGSLNNKQAVNDKAIEQLQEQKLEKEVFQMYLHHQDKRQEKADKRFDKIDTNIEIIKDKLK